MAKRQAKKIEGMRVVHSEVVAQGSFLKIHAVDIRLNLPGLPPATVQRDVLKGPDGISILPYDPDAQQILMVDEIVGGPAVNGCANFRGLISGAVQSDEGIREAAARELREEGGLEIAPHKFDIIMPPRYFSAGTSAVRQSLLYVRIDAKHVRKQGKWLFKHGEYARRILVPQAEFMAMADNFESHIGLLTHFSALWLRCNAMYLGLGKQR